MSRSAKSIGARRKVGGLLELCLYGQAPEEVVEATSNLLPELPPLAAV